MDEPVNQIIEQLVSDPSFRDWVLARPDADTVRWTNWEKDHAEQAEQIITAKAIVLALQLKEPLLSDKEIENEILRIRAGIEDLSYMPVNGQAVENSQPGGESGAAETEQKQYLQVIKRPVYRKTWFKAAAAVIFMGLSLGWLLVASQKDFSSGATSSRVEQLPLSGRYENKGDSVVQIRLPDQSLVSLSENSTIRYRYFEGKREVILSGEAFFDVSREPARPFLVHAGEIVTRVLGTSFRVRAQPGEQLAEVSVKTGKVYVAKEDDASTALILRPNQRVKYDRKRKSLEKGLVDAPEPVWEPVERKEKELFRFDRTPLREVFEELQKVYGIPIIYDERIVASCSLSATLGDEPFFEKLEMICKVVNASYEIIDGSVVIYAKGCR
ncbi:FecR family protein [Anseongella ginsenosidimutans]|uniref:FecR family protein n=1 Tax=Anseongella ginsenosidimutans TaxID=496056 RepID=A0A4R3KVB3_9SPHI|nr:FecR domain-containing protein [Anseongella ginsenosidimutans]QEC51879.1 DUF4974 domain-containing protein [Anseongella ginsenosidimutans]TCS89265.1 FecR family protein [Anseongella ginsenosidimutans]